MNILSVGETVLGCRWLSYRDALIAQHSDLLRQYESSSLHGQQIEHLKLAIEKYRPMLFGSKSEKLTGQLEQLEFQLE